MNFLNVADPDFLPYGKVTEGYDPSSLLERLKHTPKPMEGIVYRPGNAELEALPIAAALRDNLYGGMQIQVGYSNGRNRAMNCLEYHKGSETVIAGANIVLLLARLTDLEDGILDTKYVKAFFMPAGKMVQLYETTLHYAPVNAPNTDGFRTAVVLLKGTNTEKPGITAINEEDQYLFACNKWLLAHPDAPEVQDGAKIGLRGENIVL